MPKRYSDGKRKKNITKKRALKRKPATAAIRRLQEHRTIVVPATLLLLTALILSTLYFGTSPQKKVTCYHRIISFGCYPQSLVTSDELLDALNQSAPEWKPFDDCFTGHNNYGTMQPSGNMRYADVEYNGERYRAVVFDSYRPYTILDSASAEQSFQDDNGYLPGNVYWFRWEPIRWHVADEKKGVLLSEMVLDAVPFNNSFYWIDRNRNEEIDWVSEFSKLQHLELPANLYQTSTLRRWLNRAFFNVAFTSAEQRSIKTVLHRADESAANTKYGLHSLTRDRVWLFSAAEAWAWKESGLSKEVLFPDATDYAKCRGAYSGSFDDHTSAWWWTRSPGDFSGDVISIADSSMFITFDRQFPQSYTAGGVRCAVRLRNTADATEE